MPDEAGNLRGQGWTRKREAGWEKAFGSTQAEEHTLRPWNGCHHPEIRHESHSQIPYCGWCGADLA